MTKLSVYESMKKYESIYFISIVLNKLPNFSWYDDLQVFSN